MPEQLTKHPEVTLEVLRSAGARCGEGAAQQILTQCPADRFCSLPGGEMCVFGLADAGRMTQITAAEWEAVARSTSPPAGAFTGMEIYIGAGVGLLVGALVGIVAASLRRRHR